MHNPALVQMRQQDFDAFLQHAVLALGLAFFDFLENFETEVDWLELELLLAREHHHVQTWIQHHDVLLLLGLLVIEVLRGEQLVDAEELLDVLPRLHVLGLQVCEFELLLLIFLSFGFHRSTETGALNRALFVYFGHILPKLGHFFRQPKVFPLARGHAIQNISFSLLGFEPRCELIQLVGCALLAHLGIRPGVHRHRGVKDLATLDICMFLEDGHEEAALVVILWVEPHTPFEVQWVTEVDAALGIVPVRVVLVEHGLA